MQYNIEIPNGEYIEQTLQSWGVSACFKCDSFNQVGAVYSFELENYLDINKLKRLLLPLKSDLKCDIELSLNSKYAFDLIVFYKERIPLYTSDLRNDYSSINIDLKSMIGLSIYNQRIELDFEKIPHLLIGGTTGSGKSVLLNTIIQGLIRKEIKSDFLFIDCKKVELTCYKDYGKIVTESSEALTELKKLVDLMESRYTEMRYKGLKEYKGKHFFCVIDELADLMLSSAYEIEPMLVRLAQKSRACHIHLILATQRPTVNVVTGLLKANLPCRIALKVASIRDSITILDHKGAETLRGYGDAIIKFPYSTEEIRFQVGMSV